MKDITKFKMNDYEFYLEAGLLFISGRKYFFKWLADGGMVVYANDINGEVIETFFIPTGALILERLNSFMLEKLVLNEEETQEG